jgi:hypothetical protein
VVTYHLGEVGLAQGSLRHPGLGCHRGALGIGGPRGGVQLGRHICKCMHTRTTGVKGWCRGILQASAIISRGESYIYMSYTDARTDGGTVECHDELIGVGAVGLESGPGAAAPAASAVVGKRGRLKSARGGVGLHPAVDTLQIPVQYVSGSTGEEGRQVNSRYCMEEGQSINLICRPSGMCKRDQ